MKRHADKKSAAVNLGFQIAPMIDVVFVVMLYFMVMAGTAQIEKAHNTTLPGDGPPVPAEIAIRIEDDGQIYLNEDPLDGPEAKLLPELAATLKQLRECGAETLVTIYAGDLAKYQRIVDVLDALSRAKISNVTFQAGAPE
jgi:biopolymer transport protein ExbD